MTKPSFCYKMNTLLLGEWLNGRVAVSKTVGCVFESRLPCQIVYRVFRYTIFLHNLFLARNRLRLTLLFARFRSQTTLFRRCAPYESRLPCQIVYRVFRYTIFLRYLFLTRNRLRLTLLFARFLVANNAVPSLRSLRIASPLPDRVSCFSVHDFFYAIVSHPQQVASDAFVCSLPVANNKNHECRKINNI